MDSLEPGLVGSLAKVVVGGEREGWLSWRHLTDTSSSSHQAANTHKETVPAST